MFLDKKSLPLAFALALFFTLVIPILVPGLTFYFFAPVVVIAMYQKSRLGACWVAFGCGVILDILYAQDRFGPFIASFMVATIVIYSQKRHFFADTLITLPVMTYLFSLAVTAFQLLLIAGMERSVNISFKWIVTDLIFMPMLDGIFAFLIFIAPAFLFGIKPRRGEEYFAE